VGHRQVLLPVAAIGIAHALLDVRLQHLGQQEEGLIDALVRAEATHETPPNG
jgi:hypothetical protein